MNYQLFLQIFGKRYWKQRLLISANAIKLHKLFHNHPNGDSSLFWPLLERYISFVLLKWKTMICLRELIINVCYFIVGKKKIEKKNGKQSMKRSFDDHPHSELKHTSNENFKMPILFVLLIFTEGKMLTKLNEGE